MASFKQEKKILIRNIKKYLEDYKDINKPTEDDEKNIRKSHNHIFWFLMKFEYFTNRDELIECGNYLQEYMKGNKGNIYNIPSLENVYRNIIYLVEKAK